VPDSFYFSKKKNMNFDYAIHSDFLIHWTGKDIDVRDAKGNPIWCKTDKSQTKPNEKQEYIKRLRDILKFGLWMTEEDGNDFLKLLTISKTCFTELKLSESRKHAKSYGRLGIGVKRMFLFYRNGRPVVYYLGGRKKDDIFLNSCINNLQDKTLLNFFKPMNSFSKPLTYDLYAESEWRILYFEDLLKKRLIIDPRDPQNKKEHNYFKNLTPSEQAKLKYLIPLDGWFAMIIYPSLDVKNEAQQDNSLGIRGEIERIKEIGKNESDIHDHANRVEGGNWPIEMNLDACRNF